MSDVRRGNPSQAPPAIPWRPHGGFTLMEVLVSLVILSICLAVVFQNFSLSSRLAFRSDQLAEATRIASNLLSDEALMLEAVRRESAEGEVAGEEGWSYTVTAAPLEISLREDYEPVEVPNMVELELCVRYESEGSSRAYCVQRWRRRE
ncbi:MAG: type II secretion system protein [Thermodesulfobacteriota bacterium]|nr:type II secretion system protein [Thermodesulfobacteriota bacterium]